MPFDRCRHDRRHINRGLRVTAARAALAACIAATALLGYPASAKQVLNQVAVFAGLDKITGKISKFEVPLAHTAVFGRLRVTPRVCYTRPPDEAPKTTAFVEVSELRHAGGVRRIFTGWMFAANPGLHAVEHPVYDVWLTDCKRSSTPAPSSSPPKR